MQTPLAPVAEPNSPAPQRMQTAEPVVGCFWPAAQRLHTKLQDASAYMCAGHFWQMAWPDWLLARPGMHGRHDADPLLS